MVSYLFLSKKDQRPLREHLFDMVHHEYYSTSVRLQLPEDIYCANETIHSVVTGILGTLIFGLSLRDASLITVFFSILCSLPVAYLSTLGLKTGLRQLIQASYSFG